MNVSGAGGVGSAVGCIGGTTYSGGSGGTGSGVATGFSGGGGGSAGSTGAGGNGSGNTAGTAGAVGGAAGGSGLTSSGTGNGGSSPGAGGSGGLRISGTTDRAGGSGANGRIKITYLGYCTTNPATVNGSDIITNVSITNANGFNFSNTTTNASTGETNNYVVFNNTPVDLYIGTSNTLSVKFGTDGTQWSAAWIDFNHNLIYEASENIALATSSAGGSATVTYTFTVPAGTTPGNTRMRVRGGADVTYSAGGACTVSSFGETEDYIVNIANALSCLPPGTPSVSSITGYTASVSFTASASAPAQGYDYYISTSNTAPTAGSAVSGNITASPSTIAGLAPTTTYYLWLRSNCSATDKSVWTASAATFTTMVSCLPTGTLSTSNITFTSAQVRFVASASAPAQGYDYYSANTNVAPAASAVPAGNVADTFINLTGNFNTSPQYVWVRARCGNTDQSTWTGPVYLGYCRPSGTNTSSYFNSFSTTGGTANINNAGSGYATGGYQDATNMSVSQAPGLPVNFNTSLTGTTVGVAIWVDWNDDMTFDNTTERMYSTTGYVSTASGSFTVPASAATGNHRMRAVMDYNSSSPASCSFASGGRGEIEDYTFTVLPSPSCYPVTSSITISNITATTANASFSPAFVTPSNGYDYYVSTTNTAPTAANAPSGTGTAIPLTMNNLAPSTMYYVWIRSNCGSSQSNWSTNNGTFTTTATCLPPTGLSVSAITQTSANVNFTASVTPPANGYDYYISTTNATPSAASTPTGNIASLGATIGSLTANTVYYLWLRSQCSPTDQSVWSSPVSFTTLCLAIGVPYVQQFESVTTPAIPNCTSVQNVGSGNNWTTAANPASNGFPASDGQVLRYSYNVSFAANTWWYTQGIELTAGTNYSISYKYGNNGASFTEKMKVAYGTEAVNTAMTNQLADHASINQASAQVNTVYFTPAVSGVYYFGFNAYSATNQFNLYLDNVKIDLAPGCIPVSALTAGNITSTSANLHFNASSSNPDNGYDYYISTANTAPDASTTATGNGANIPLTLSNLTPATTYYVWVRSNCGASGQSTWSSNVSFTTNIVNDMPSGAVLLTVGAGCSGNPYDNTFATQSTLEPFPNCRGSAGYAGMWYKFVAPASGAVKVSCDGTGTLGDSRMALFTGGNVNDYNTFQIIACDDDNGITTGSRSLFYAAGLTPGQTYYVDVDLFSSSATKGTYCVTVDELSSSMLATTAADCASDQGSVSTYNATYKGWISLVDANGNLNANVRQNAGSATGFSSSRTIKTGTARTDANGHAYLNRNFQINGSGATSADVQLFFTDAELTNLNAPLSGLNVTKVGGTTCSANFTDGSGINTLLSQTASGSANGVNYIQVNTPSFSNFYIMNGTTPLPITFEYFKGKKMDKANRLEWKVNNNETGAVSMALQRSEDGKNFVTLNEQQITAANSQDAFSYDDRSWKAASNIYRIRLTSEDSKETYSQTVTLINSNKGFEVMNIIPNPVKNQSVIKLVSAEAGKVIILVSDIAGRVLTRQESNVSEGENMIEMNFSHLHAGTYQISVTNDSGISKTLRFVKH